jgi:hypothetical protein
MAFTIQWSWHFIWQKESSRQFSNFLSKYRLINFRLQFPPLRLFRSCNVWNADWLFLLHLWLVPRTIKQMYWVIGRWACSWVHTYSEILPENWPLTPKTEPLHFYVGSQVQSQTRAKIGIMRHITVACLNTATTYRKIPRHTWFPGMSWHVYFIYVITFQKSIIGSKINGHKICHHTTNNGSILTFL